RHLGAVDGVLPDDRELLVGELPRLEEDGVWYGDLADVMQVGAPYERLQQVPVDRELVREAPGEADDAVGVAAGLQVPVLEREPEGAEGGLAGGLDLLQVLDALEGVLQAGDEAAGDAQGALID